MRQPGLNAEMPRCEEGLITGCAHWSLLCRKPEMYPRQKDQKQDEGSHIAIYPPTLNKMSAGPK